MGVGILPSKPVPSSSQELQLEAVRTCQNRLGKTSVRRMLFSLIYFFPQLDTLFVKAKMLRSRQRDKLRPYLVLYLFLIHVLVLLEQQRIQASIVVDEALYSRQLYVLGLPAQQRLAASNILVVGLGGVGVEITKNVILAGPQSVTLIDPTPARMVDLATQYYLDETSLGQSRAMCSYAKLKELNPLVQLDLLEPSSMDIEAVAEAIAASGRNFDVIVAADQDKASEEALNTLARRLKAKFVAAQAPGLFGSIFCDMGDDFTVNDTDGKEAKTGLLKSFDPLPMTGETLVTLREGERHDLSKGDLVYFERTATEEDGQTKDAVRAGSADPDLETDTFTVKRIVSPSCFTVPASANLVKQVHQYSNGRFRQLKQPLQLGFQPLTLARQAMRSVPTDFGKASLGRQLTLHACFESLKRFKTHAGGRLPIPGSATDAAAFKKLVKSCDVLSDVISSHSAAIAARSAAKRPTSKTRAPSPPVLDEQIMEIFARTCQGSLAPICSFVGGTAAQEVLKACTGTFVPLQQYLFFDAVEVLTPESGEDESPEAFSASLPSEKECASRGDKYDGMRAVLGSRLMKLLQDQAIFVVGAGAIGCELLKNLALMGVGPLTVTDNDSIEKSNLNRQFLFRERDLGAPKSEAAAQAVQRLNPDVEVRALVRKVGKETEEFFDDNFWFGHDVVANALDNVAARKYVDGRCVYYRRPLLESGTEGTSGNVQVVVPFVTESYGSSVDPPEASIPVCTLKSFPYMIEHCIQWARDFFDGYFRIQPERLNDLTARLSESSHRGEEDDAAAAAVLASLRAQTSDETLLRELEGYLVDLEIWDPVPSARRCVKWALDRFHELYQSNIEALLREHPRDSVTEDGEPFWSGDRRIPTPIVFDQSDPLHMDFLLSAALLKARVFNVVDPTTTVEGMSETVQATLDEILASGYQAPTEVVRAEEEEEGDLEAKVQREFEEVRLTIKRIAKRGGDNGKGTECTAARTRPEMFEKDQDWNGHIAFITSASNLRAANYGLARADRLQTKKIAGRIIPAIATTTAVVAGLASLELCKLAQRSLLEEEEEYSDLESQNKEEGLLKQRRRHRRHYPPLSAYRNAFINLAGPFFALTQPMEAHPIALGEQGEVYNMWDRLEVTPKKDMTLKSLLAHASENFGLQITSVTLHGSHILYADFMHPGDDNPILGKSMTELVEAAMKSENRAIVRKGVEGTNIQGMPLRRHFVDFEIECVDDAGDEVESPPLRYFFPHVKKRKSKGRRPLAHRWWGGVLKAISK